MRRATWTELGSLLAIAVVSALPAGALGNLVVASGAAQVDHAGCSSPGILNVQADFATGLVLLEAPHACSFFLEFDAYYLRTDCTGSSAGDLDCKYTLADGTSSHLFLGAHGEVRYTYAHATAGTWIVEGQLTRV